MDQSTQFYIAGVDEVGRGPLAGPVIAAAVILDVNNPIRGITDSKKLTAARRKILASEIKAKAIAWAIGSASVEEIDQLNIHHATLLAMQRAVVGLAVLPDKIQIDGKFCPQLDCPAEAIVKGDLTVPVIGAASIVAKETRDAEMHHWHTIYPQYGFDRHVGYGTKFHLEALAKYGITPLHRRSYAPVQQCLLLSDG